jgi:hypothetical protein
VDKQPPRGEKHNQAKLARSNAEKELRAEYLKFKESIALADILEKSKSFMSYHSRVAQDGVAYEFDKDGQEHIVRLTADQRVGHMDRAAGIGEMVDYIERKITIEPEVNKEEKDG